MITKTDDTIDSDVDLTHIMLDIPLPLKIDTQNDIGVIMDDENYSIVI